MKSEETKICYKCGEEKFLSDYNLEKARKTGRSDWCRSCKAVSKIEYYRTIPGLISRIYSNQKYRSKKNGFPLPSYSKQELMDWITSQRKFSFLWDAWVDSGYDKMSTPSVDRRNDYLPYRMDNIQLVDWRMNKNKFFEDKKNGVNNKNSKAVIAIDVKTGERFEFYSAHEAARRTGIAQTNISACCAEKTIIKKGGINYTPRTAGGYRWKFAEKVI